MRGRGRARPPADRWAVSYGDLLTLLLAVFVVLYASSALDAERFEDMAEGVRHRFGDPSASSPIQAIPLDATREGAGEDAQRLARIAEELRRRVEPLLSAEIPRRAVAVELQARGLVVSLATDVLFDRGGRLRPRAEPVLRELAAVLRGHPGTMRVESHEALDGTAGPAFDSAAERSAALARALVERHRVPSSQLAAIAYSGIGEEGRINVVMLSAAARKAEPAGHEGASAVRALLQQLDPPPDSGDASRSETAPTR